MSHSRNSRSSVRTITKAPVVRQRRNTTSRASRESHKHTNLRRSRRRNRSSSTSQTSSNNHRSRTRSRLDTVIVSDSHSSKERASRSIHVSHTVSRGSRVDTAITKAPVVRERRNTTSRASRESHKHTNLRRSRRRNRSSSTSQTSSNNHRSRTRSKLGSAIVGDSHSSKERASRSIHVSHTVSRGSRVDTAITKAPVVRERRNTTGRSGSQCHSDTNLRRSRTWTGGRSSET